jgi:rubredoxin
VVLSEESEVEKRRRTTFGPKNKPQWECQQCKKKFDTNKGMTMHRVKTHNYRVEHRKLVQEVQKGEAKHKCLLCNKIYASKQGAQLHLDKHCTPKFTADEIVNALARHGFL